VKKLVEVSPVVEALVSTEVEAKMLEEKILRNLRAAVPRVYVVFVSGMISRKGEVATETESP
jgi:hypothetical protein